MASPLVSIPKPMAGGLLLALFAILLGFGLGMAFGGAESKIKDGLNASGTAVLDTAYQGDAAKKDAVVEKSWRYLQRSHMHGSAIGTAAVAAIAILLLVSRLGILAQASALAFGAGALLYSIFWLRAGFVAPGLGSTGAAKEALKFLALPGAGLSMLGLLGTIVTVIKDNLFAGSAANEKAGDVTKV